MEAYVTLSLLTGLRTEEVRALRWAMIMVACLGLVWLLSRKAAEG